MDPEFTPKNSALMIFSGVFIARDVRQPVHHSTFSSSEDEAETLAVSLLQDGGLLLDHVVAGTRKTLNSG